MKTIPQLQAVRAVRLCGTVLTALAGCFAAGLAAADAAPPSLQLPQPGRWPAWSQGGLAYDVQVRGNYAFVAFGERGLSVFDISNPTNCVQVSAYDTGGAAFGVTLSGDYAYVAALCEGLHVVDVSNPTNCVRVGGHDTSGAACGVTLVGNHAYVADNTGGLQVIDVSDPAHGVRVYGDVAEEGNHAVNVTVAGGCVYVTAGTTGLQILTTLPDVQFSVRVDATPGVPFTVETATNLSAPNPWTPLLTTNVSSSSARR